MRIVYVPIRERYCGNHHTYRTYSILCCRKTENRLSRICIFHDITLDRRQAQKIASLCTDAQIEPCHFMDIVYDLSAAGSVCGFVNPRGKQAAESTEAEYKAFRSIKKAPLLRGAIERSGIDEDRTYNGQESRRR